jgi:hypothetical protein
MRVLLSTCDNRGCRCLACGAPLADPKAVCESCLQQLAAELKSDVPPPPAPTHGPGTELKKLLKKVGITATPSCSCNARARRMDEEEAKEPGWCEAHLDEIVGWLREEAEKRGLPFVDMAGRVLVRRAISNARKAEASRAKEASNAKGQNAEVG